MGLDVKVVVVVGVRMVGRVGWGLGWRGSDGGSGEEKEREGRDGRRKERREGVGEREGMRGRDRDREIKMLRCDNEDMRKNLQWQAPRSLWFVGTEVT